MLNAPNDGTGGGSKHEGAGGSKGQSSTQNPQAVMFPSASNSKFK